VGEYIHPAIEAARRGSKLIRGLLTFSRKQAIEARIVDLNPLVSGVQDLVKHTLPSTQELVTDVNPLPILVSVDPQQLQNSLLNLILNAHDATAGQGRIEVRSTLQPLEGLQASRLGLAPGPYACLQVNDNGCGMDAGTRARVFEPFFTTKSAGQGTGLGLSMVYGFVRQSGGGIDLQSSPGRGTCVSLWLPQAPSDAVVDVADPAAPVAPSTAAGLALLVDDDLQVRVTVRRLLLDLGYAVLEAENGAEALDILEQTPGIQLLLSDIVMPGAIDGRQLARYARQSGEVAHILLMSGYAAESESPLDAPLLAKPFGKAELSAALREIGA
jgi:CheY-like chemotaxis protein